MNKTLVIDCNNLCYAAMYKMGHLSSSDERMTGVIYGFLRMFFSIVRDKKLNRFVFCWDSKTSYRKEIYPQYKEGRRKNLTWDERKNLMLAFKQFKLLRKEILPALGFRNIFYQKGYEADDIVARVVKNSEGKVIIVSNDADLYQLLSRSVSMYKPQSKKIVTSKSFRKDYGIRPKDWALVKAIAGCSGDNVIGIPGVGEKTAIRWLKKELKKGTASKKIEEGIKIWRKNLEVVKLPFFYNTFKKNKRLKNFKARKENSFQECNFREVFEEYEFNSFLGEEFDKIVKLFGAKWRI